MATINSATYDAQFGENPRYRLDNSVLTAEVRFAEIEYVVKGTEAANDVINLCDLPIGAMVYPEHCAVVSEGIGGTGVTFSKVGDAKVLDRYSAAALALTAAGWVPFVVVPANRIAPFVIDSETKTIKATLVGTLPATAGKKVRVRIGYRLPT